MQLKFQQLGAAARAAAGAAVTDFQKLENAGGAAIGRARVYTSAKVGGLAEFTTSTWQRERAAAAQTDVSASSRADVSVFGLAGPDSLDAEGLAVESGEALMARASSTGSARLIEASRIEPAAGDILAAKRDAAAARAARSVATKRLATGAAVALAGAGVYIAARGVEHPIDAMYRGQVDVTNAKQSADDARAKDAIQLHDANIDPTSVHGDPSSRPGATSNSFFSGLDSVAKTGVVLALVIGGLVVAANLAKKHGA